MEPAPARIFAGRLPAVFLSVLLLCAGWNLPVWGADETTQDAASDPEIRRLEERAKVMINAFEEERCRKRGMVRYHGTCMEEEERSALFELEIRHLESLLGDAISMYEIATPEDVGWAFHQAEQFADKVEQDEVIDERIEEKLLLLLGFIYKSSDRLANEMKREMQNPKGPGEMLAFLEKRERMNAFLNQVHIPLMRLLGKQMDAYVLWHGMKGLEKLLTNNSLREILIQIER